MNSPGWMKGSTASVFRLPMAEVVSHCLRGATGENGVSEVTQSTESMYVAFPGTEDSLACPTCLACGLTFDSRAEQVAHFKTEAHRVSLQRRSETLSGENGRNNGNGNGHAGSVDEDANEDIDNEDDADEIDSSTVEDEDYADFGESSDPSVARWWLRRGQPTVCVAGPAALKDGDGDGGSGGGCGKGGNTSWAVGIPIPLLGPSRKGLAVGGLPMVRAGLSALASAPTQSWAVLLLRSGRFAGGVFQGEHLLLHRSFKRYTTRRGQGGSQSSADGGKSIKSAGSNLRRHGEAMLAEDTRALLRGGQDQGGQGQGEWGPALKGCSLIFVACPKGMHPLFFGSAGGGSAHGGGQAPLRKDDPRVRMVASAGRPGLAEVKEVHRRLSTLELYPDVRSVRQADAATAAAADATLLRQHALEESRKKASAASVVTAESQRSSQEPANPPAPPLLPPSRFYSAVMAGDLSALEEAIADLKQLEEEDQGQEEGDGRGGSNGGGAVSTTAMVIGRLLDLEAFHDGVRHCGGVTSSSRGENAAAAVKAAVAAAAAAAALSLPPPPPAVGAATEAGASSSSPSVEAVLPAAGTATICPSDAETALHLACRTGRQDLVACLLAAGSDPTTLDSRGRVPVYCTSDGKVRDAFRKHRALLGEGGGPRGFDWQAARVPEPLTEELVARKKEKEREKKRRARERVKREKATLAATRKAASDALAKQEADAKAAFEAAEAAFLAGNACDGCGQPIPSRRDVAFARLDFKYCSSACVQTHRRALQAEAAERRFSGS
mmetsp:Transcript_3824/g.7062  ORF Transcript_3824/g.7062 Transcript_3824/m.7062 type:complete len:780 (-) Transcript_3824:226-2565(-)